MGTKSAQGKKNRPRTADAEERIPLFPTPARSFHDPFSYFAVLCCEYYSLSVSLAPEKLRTELKIIPPEERRFEQEKINRD